MVSMSAITSADGTVPKVLLDCDPGIDDTLALIYLAALHRAGEIDLVAVTTTAGNVDVELTAANAAWILELCGVADVPVAAGLSGPETRALVTTPETHGPTGLGYMTAPGRTISAGRKVPVGAAWRELWKRAAGAQLIVTGPLTNAASAVDLLDSFESVTIMGGAVDYPGNTTPTAEWNFWVDPEAADRVLSCSGARQSATPTLCSLGVTEQFLVGPDRLNDICVALGACPVAEPLPEILRFYFEFHEAHGQGYQAQIHDLLTCILALGRASYNYEECALRVLWDEQRRGSVVPAEQTQTNMTAPAARVVTSADIATAHGEFLRSCELLSAIYRR